MGFRFARRVTLFPGVRLNFSRKGISASIGPRGASVTLGPRGTALNVGVPGTGLSFRQQLSGGGERPGGAASYGAGTPVPDAPTAAAEFTAVGATAIQSAPVEEVTSDGLAALKTLIVEARAEHQRLQESIPKLRRDLETATRRLARARNWFFGLFLKAKIPERAAAVEAKAAELARDEERLAAAFVDAEFALDAPAREAFDQLASAFEQLTACDRIWDITSTAAVDRRASRSAASTAVDRKPVRFSIREDAVLQTETKVLRLQNANGADMLMYPGFLMMSETTDFALVDLRDVRVVYETTRFHESEPVPGDARIVGQVWAKSNKDGSPDRRFKGNYQIPVAAYGELTFSTPAGVHETYLFSNPDVAERFARLFADFQAKVRALGDRDGPGSAPSPAAPGARSPSGGRSEPTVGLKSLGLIESASVVSADHGIELLNNLTSLLTEDVKTLSGSHSGAQIERLVREFARLPDALRSFFDRSPAIPATVQAPVAASLTTVVRTVVRDVRSSIERMSPVPDEAAKLLEFVKEAERTLPPA